MELLDECAPLAERLDDVAGTAVHREALKSAHQALHDPERTPSARVLREMNGDHGNSYIAFALGKSLEHRREFIDASAASTEHRLQRMAEESLAHHRAIEAADDETFEQYRLRYLARDLTSGMRLD